MLSDIIKVVLERRNAVDRYVRADGEVVITGGDVSARDNAALAIASERVVRGFAELRNRELINDEEYLRMVYKFAGEMIDIDKVRSDGEAAGPPLWYGGVGGGGGAPGDNVTIDVDTGEVSTSAE